MFLLCQPIMLYYLMIIMNNNHYLMNVHNEVVGDKLMIDKLPCVKNSTMFFFKKYN